MGEQRWAPHGGAETLTPLKLTHSLEVLLEVLPVDLTGQEGRFGDLALLGEGDGAHQHPQLTLSQIIPQLLEPLCQLLCTDSCLLPAPSQPPF